MSPTRRLNTIFVSELPSEISQYYPIVMAYILFCCRGNGIGTTSGQLVGGKAGLGTCCNTRASAVAIRHAGKSSEYTFLSLQTFFCFIESCPPATR